MNVTYDHNKTKQDIINEANEIWHSKATIDIIYNKHPEFSKAYPLVVRLITEGLYNQKAFQMYLNKIEKKPWTNEESYLDSLADYVKLLYRTTTTKYDTNEAKRIWENTRCILQKENTQFKDNLAKATKKIEQQEIILAKDSRDDLKDFFKIVTNLDNTKIVVQSDLSANVVNFEDTIKKLSHSRDLNSS